ncbi:MAG: tRNA (adenosine(37)-N6)-threonylcarbamoyltransferase complex transferase subunit TsaD [Elusimicrobia bacterium]|nr:tRNA (adenosine(37)-N6)-threonylcarbamoyltransferase complex transferase subunit TsaD [Candidatus Obscuribacterium magneticum]
MNILGIETSCDETAAAVVEDGRRILASAISSQIKLHAPYFGVVPELASRAHVTLLNAVIEACLKKIGSPHRLDAIAVTVGPGLVGSLLVGKMTAQTLGWAWNRPVFGVNHIEGHLLSPILLEKDLRPPFLGLVVSGGHTELILAKKWGVYYRIGRTRDDAAGEAFDKVAKLMNLGYPGGPIIDALAKKGDPSRFSFPRPWLPHSWDFSFSGLKTAVLYRLRGKNRWSMAEKQHICAGFQQAVVDVLVGKTLAAARAVELNRIVVGGGVAANSLLRKEFMEKANRLGIQVLLSPLSLCTDNAAMIAAAAYFKLKTHPSSAFRSLRVRSQSPFPPTPGPLPGVPLPSDLF